MQSDIIHVNFIHAKRHHCATGVRLKCDLKLRLSRNPEEDEARFAPGGSLGDWPGGQTVGLGEIAGRAALVR
ncbi:hypothetical protein U1Q18_023928 [Sarracenia purpurea var. burkii]